MTARDRWEMTLKCPVCEKEGVAEVSQADGWAFERDQSTSVDSLSAGFSYEADKDGHLKFSCVEHGPLRK